MDTWQAVWKAHPDFFIADQWLECPSDKKKDYHLPAQYDYFSGGETSLRVGIIASSKIPKEEEFLLAGMLWGRRMSNGAKTVIYFVAPDFSPFFLQALNKVGGILNARAVYWREKLTPSLYLIPETSSSTKNWQSLGEERLNWSKWRQELNPVVQLQFDVVKTYFEKLHVRRVRADIKFLNITFLWGNLEIAEIRRKGKRFELATKTKWLRDHELTRKWQKSGWVDASGVINPEFCQAIAAILDYLEDKEKKGELRPKDALSLYLHQGEGIISTLWGNEWEWPWVSKERGENWIHELGQWFYFQGGGHLSVVCPILEKPLALASQSLLLSCVLKNSSLLDSPKIRPSNISWDGRIFWLTIMNMEEDLRLFQSWLKNPEPFQIWTLPENWQTEGIEQLSCRSISQSAFKHFDEC